MGVIRNLADYVVMLVGGYIYTRLTSEHLTDDRELAELLEKGLT
jgi:hypothetical protein